MKIYVLLSLMAFAGLAASHPPKPALLAPPAYQTCWQGTINGKVPVFIQYCSLDSVISGYITYLNTKEKKPLSLIGTLEADHSYRLLEFDSTGNISGVLLVTPEAGSLKGSWISPRTGKEFPLAVLKKDSLLAAVDLRADPEKIFGTYNYQYGEFGSQGGLELKRISGNKASFSISAVTDAPARNVAEVPEDKTAIRENEFTYRPPNSENCAFRIQLYRGFARITYTEGYCMGQFGNNATVEGIFLKIK